MTDDPTSDDLTSGDRLGEILHSAVPDGPDPIGRADAVVRRGRAAKRRHGASGVLAVGVVALAVVVGPNLLDTGSGPSHQAGPGHSPGLGTPPEVAQLDHQYTCPKAGEPDRHASVPPTDSIPAGAILARICPLAGKELSPWSPPLEALVTHVDLVSQAYNDLPKGQPLPCPGSPTPRPGFSVTFQYPDGHLVRVSAETIGTGVCDFISIDGRKELGRSSSETVMHTYLTELRRQEPLTRVWTSVPDSAPRCHSRFVPPSSSLILGEGDLQLGSARLCVYASSTTRPPSMQQRVLSAAGVATVNRDFARRSTPGAPAPPTCRGPSGGILVIIGWSRLGDLYRLEADACTGDFAAGVRQWHPGPSVQHILYRN